MKGSMVGRLLCLACVTVSLSPSVARANRADGCRVVSGQIFELEVPADEGNNPVNHGRVVAVVTGALKGAETAILTGVAAPPPGAHLGVTTQNVFVNKRGEMLVADGLAGITFNPDSTVTDDLTLTVDGASSTGRFAGATGSIRAVGTGFNFGGGPGVGRFVFRYRGQICGITGFDDDDE